MSTLVAVDVFSWVTAAIDHPSIPIEGIYRHAESLALKFYPVIWQTLDDLKKHPRLRVGIEKLEKHLGKRIRVFTRVEEIEQEKINVWMSIALDSPAPILGILQKIGVYRVAVLHDTMAYQGLFGAGNQATFAYGTSNNDCLLPVSKFAWEDYQRLPASVPKIREKVDYSCFHRFPTYPSVKQKRTQSISVGTVYPRKRVANTALTALSLNLVAHHHVGRFVKSEDDALFNQLVEAKRLINHGFIEDRELTSMMAESFAYLNLSEQEGFSMPPLEAIVLGVPYIFLSDIPVHRELYQGVANFIEPGDSIMLAGAKAVTEDRRRRYFEKYCFSAAIKPFLDFIS